MSGNDFTLPMQRLLHPKHKDTKICEKPSKPSWYSLESSLRVVLDEYPRASVSVIFQFFCIDVYWAN